MRVRLTLVWLLALPLCAVMLRAAACRRRRCSPDCLPCSYRKPIIEVIYPKPPNKRVLEKH